MVSSRIKNPGLVREKHLLIAKKASGLFVKKGYSQTTIRQISKATGMAIGNLYDYISKKEDILYLVVTLYHQYLENCLDSKGTFAVKNPKDSLRLFVHKFLKNKKDYRNGFILTYHESRFLPKEHLVEVTKMEIEQIRKLEQIIREGINQGIFNSEEPYFSAGMIIHQLNILALKSWIFEGKYSEEEVDDLIEDSILKSISY